MKQARTSMPWIDASGRRWIAVTLPGDGGEVHVALPAAQATRDATPTDDAEAIEETRAFACGLMRQHRIRLPGEAASHGATHEIVVDPESGRRLLVRRGFG